MKGKSKPKPSKREEKAFASQEFIDRVNSGRKDAAVGEYLDGEAHRSFIIAELFRPMVARRTKELERGIVGPQLAICCCRDTFVRLLAGKPIVKYVACSDKWPDDSIDEDYNRGKFPKDIGDMSIDDQFNFLVDNDYCYAHDKRVVYMPDQKRRDEYAAAVGEYLVTAAALAKGVGSEAAEMFMEAIRLLQRRSVQRIDDGENCIEVGANEAEISEACAKAAYDAAEKAQGKLWVDIELAKVRPIRLPRKRSNGDRS